jgi:hypothetical protein
MVRMLAAAMLLGLQGPEEEYPALVAAEAAKQRQNGEDLRAAHQALDEGRYEQAVELAKRARLLDQELGKIRSETRACLRKLIAELVAKLDDDDFEVREAASGKLRALGPAAVPGLVRIRATRTSPESRYRIDELLQGVSVDASGRIHQWAGDAAASSEYSPTDWSAKQVTGPPDSLQGGDARTAWAPKEADAGPEWLHLKYLVPVRISKLRIFENYTPGGVVAVDVVGLDGVRRRAWEGEDPGGAAPVCFEVDLKGAVGREVVIVLDTKKNSGWEEIDAVELIGDLLEE